MSVLKMRDGTHTFKHLTCTANCFSNLLSEIQIGFVANVHPQGDSIRDAKMQRLSGMFCTGTLQIRSVH